MKSVPVVLVSSGGNEEVEVQVKKKDKRHLRHENWLQSKNLHFKLELYRAHTPRALHCHLRHTLYPFQSQNSMKFTD